MCLINFSVCATKEEDEGRKKFWRKKHLAQILMEMNEVNERVSDSHVYWVSVVCYVKRN